MICPVPEGFPRRGAILHRRVRRANGRTTVMARTRRIKDDRGAHYHVMSRTNDRRFLFERGRIKREIAGILRRSADFSGVRLEAYCLMDDHFHVVCHVAKPDEPVPEEEVIRRIGVLKGGQFAADLAERWSELRSCGLGAAVDAALKSWRARMNDVSQFAKTFKELVSIAYKASVRGFAGWDLRLRSVCVGHSPSARVPAGRVPAGVRDDGGVLCVARVQACGEGGLRTRRSIRRHKMWTRDVGTPEKPSIPY